MQERKVGTDTVTSHFLFGGGLRPKVEFRNDGTTTTAHYTIYGPGGRVVSYISSDSDGDPVRLTPIHDRLGSTRALIDSSGAVKARFGYNTMGKPTETDGCTGDDTSCDQYREYPYRFQGHRYLPFEDETASTGDYIVGVTDNVDRLYSHDHGLRFMHTDLAGASISPYTAYLDDPVNIVDWNGLMGGLCSTPKNVNSDDGSYYNIDKNDEDEKVSETDWSNINFKVLKANSHGIHTGKDVVGIFEKYYRQQKTSNKLGAKDKLRKSQDMGVEKSKKTLQ